MAILENKVAIVTGAGSGIGRAIALFYAREGAKVVVSDINQAGGEETVNEIIATGGTGIFFKADTSSIEDNRLLVEKAVQEFGGLHIACNNAGIGGPMGPTADYPIDGWNKVIGINLSGVFYGMHFQVAAMLKSGGGAIVNIASILGAVGTRFSPAYVAAKHGVVGLTKATALEYASQGVRVNSIGPGYILTPLLTNAFDEAAMEQVKSLHPIGRLGTSEEVAELALWLSSDKASFVTGSYYAVDGGYLAQ